jgi:AcrR family transcriptional regulator
MSRRSVFNHFADLAELYDAVVEVGMACVTPLSEIVSEDEPIAERLEHLVEVHTEFLEATSAFTLALTAQALVGSAKDQALRVSKDALRTHHQDITGLFRRELAALPTLERAEVQEAMSAAMAPLLWEGLRRSRGHSMRRARGVVKRMLIGVLRDAGVEV